MKKKYLCLGQCQIPLHDLTAAAFLVAPDAFSLQYRFAEIATTAPYSGALLLDQHMYKRKYPNCLIAKDPEISRIKYEIIRAFTDKSYESTKKSNY